MGRSFTVCLHCGKWWVGPSLDQTAHVCLLLAKLWWGVRKVSGPNSRSARKSNDCIRDAPAFSKDHCSVFPFHPSTQITHRSFPFNHVAHPATHHSSFSPTSLQRTHDTFPLLPHPPPPDSFIAKSQTTTKVIILSYAQHYYTHAVDRLTRLCRRWIVHLLLFVFRLLIVNF
ncbi:unnamed protein product [Sphenostylis stenocarpa]|uniref:Uncharacterized protein n=1 Tax=Sphenostylis stenocarpa TaxID=92480 RepID=A0AA86RTC8_9FABA|nr:unnamed protein product [Sphenostylis stenocarpa]